MKEVHHSRDYFIIFLALFSTGLASLLYEVVLISVVTTIVGATEIAVSIVLASFLLGLAVGALLGGKASRGVKKFRLIRIFGMVELIISLFGFSFLFIITQLVSSGWPSHLLFWVIVGALFIPTTLMGMEIPIAVALLDRLKRKNSTGFVYFADTLGGVVGALFTGLVFIPALGFHGSMFFGAILNMFTFFFIFMIGKKRRGLSFLLVALIIILISLFSAQGGLENLKEHFIDSFYAVGSAFHDVYYTEPVYSSHSPYQHIVILDNVFYGRQLLLDGAFQVSDKASLVYHEFLVLPAIAAHPTADKVLVLGGGDGGALHQLLKFNFSVIDHVDLDEQVIKAAKKYLPNVHRGALDDERVTRHIMDGRMFLRESSDKKYDLIIIDLPDPSKLALAPLYSQEFYVEVRRVLKDDGLMIMQLNSPYTFLEAFTSAYKTIGSVLPHTHPYLAMGTLYTAQGYIAASKGRDPRIVRNYDVKGAWYTPTYQDNIFEIPAFFTNYFENSSVQVSTDYNPMIHVYRQNHYYFRGVADPPFQNEGE